MKRNILLFVSLLLVLTSCNNKKNVEESLSSSISNESSIIESSSIVELSSIESSTTMESSTSQSIKKIVRSINIDDFAHGEISANKVFAYAGDEITLEINVDEGYELLDGNLKYNDIVIENNTFIMPDENVDITALFTKKPVVYPQTDMIITSIVNNNEAKAYIEAKYELAGISFKITVIDNEIISDGYDPLTKDSIFLLINKQSDIRGLVGDETIKFVASSDGYYEIYRATSKLGFSEKNDMNLNIAPGNNFFTNAYTTSIDDKNAYVINAYFGYDLLGTNYDEGYQNITICPGLTNANKDGINVEYGQNGYSYKCYWKNASTFALITGTNTFIQRATGSDTDILDESALPENYIQGVNVIGQDQWNMAWVRFSTPVSLENVTSVMVEVRFNASNSGDWFRLGARTSDDIFYDAFGKDSSTPFNYSCTTNIPETANYNWETGQWGGWDPSWTSKIAPTYYVEVPLEYMFARFGLTGNMSEEISNPLSNGTNKELTQLGIYLTANSKYDFSIGRCYVRRNGVLEQISDPNNYSLVVEEGKDYCYASKIDSNQEKETALDLVIYSN